MYKSLPFDELCALYALGDACLVTSTRDGMNLVCYEYISSQQENQGVVLLSEFAGAAESLSGSVIFNPWNIDAVADSIHTGLEMSQDMRQSNFQKLHRYILKYTSEFWGQSFITELSRMSEQADERENPYSEKGTPAGSGTPTGRWTPARQGSPKINGQ